MTPGEAIFWWGLMAAGLVASAMYSGLETGAYSINRVRLQVYTHRGRPSAKLLRRLLAQPTTLLGTLLIANNIANYTGTAALTVILESWQLSDWQTILANLCIVTPLLFVFGETLPKDTFGAYADRLMYRFAGVLDATRRLFTWLGLLPLVTLFSKGLTKLIGGSEVTAPFHPRRQVSFLVKEGVGSGLLSDEQSAIVERVLVLRDRTVGGEMTPWVRVDVVRLDTSVDELWSLANASSRSRFPVLDKKGAVVGVLNILDVLMQPRDACPPIGELMRPPVMLRHNLPLRDGLAELRQHNDALAVITRDGKPAGVASIKDLVEPITGELASW